MDTTELRTDRLGATVALFRDAHDARRAIEHLSRQGIEAGRIELDPDRDPERERSEPRRAQRVTDAGTTRRLGRRLGQGAGIGALVGAVVGAVVLGWVAGATVPALLVGALGGGFAGAGLGALTGLQATPTMSRAWESSFSPDTADQPVVRVEHAPDAGDRIRRTLESAGAVEVREVGPR
jgi:uncharacterized protein YcfJ